YSHDPAPPAISTLSLHDALPIWLAKLALDSTVQREIGEEIRSSAFAVSETLNQVANVAGSLAGVLVSILDNGEAGLAIAAAFLTDRKSTRLNSSHVKISYAVFCL